MSKKHLSGAQKSKKVIGNLTDLMTWLCVASEGYFGQY